MKKTNLLFGALMFMSNMTFVQAQTSTNGDTILPEPADLQNDYEYYEVLSDEFNGDVSETWLMDYMPWWSDSAKREKSGTRTRYRYIDAATQEDESNKSLQIYVNGENRMDEENFQPYYLEMLAGPTDAEAKDKYLAKTSEKNNWNSKFAGFMAGSKNYLNTYRGSQAQIQSHVPYDDSGATTYGYFETRAKFLPMKKGQGLAPAFWFIGMQDDIYDRGEVDGFEFLDNYTLDFTIHPKGDPRIKKVTKQIKFTEDMSKEYHTYGVLWDTEGIALYVDGELKHRFAQKIDYRMIPMFSINHHENGWIGSVDGKGHPEERTMDIDYYRVFKQKGVDPEPNKVVLPKMEEGKNIASAAYISLFGLTGTEVDATPVQWLNDLDRSNMVLSSLNNNKLDASKLPEYLYIDWLTPATYNTIVLHAKNAMSQAPTLVDFEISEDGETWTSVEQDIKLTWATDSQMAESQTITLKELQKDNKFARLVIKEANAKQGRFGLCEVEIGQNIEAMEPEYAELPDGIDLDMKNHVFSMWDMENTLTSTTKITMTQTGSGIGYVDGVSENSKAVMFTGNTKANLSYLKAPLKSASGSQIKSDEDFTLGMWIKPTSVNVGDDQLILFQQEGSKGGKPWLFVYQGKLGTYIDGNNLYNEGQPLQANAWQYVSITHKKLDDKKGEISFYVNGELGSKVEVTTLADSDCSPSAIIGAHKGLAKGFYNGAIDRLTLLDTAISPAEMKALYNAKGSMEDVENTMYDMSSVKEFKDITALEGTISKEEIILSKNATAVFNNQYVKELPVSWNMDQFNAIDVNVPGTYTIEGTLDLSGALNVTNSKNLTVTQKVIIKAELDPTELKDVVKEINALVEADYTEESFESFLSACQSTQTKDTLVLIGKYPNYAISEILPESTSQEDLDRMHGELHDALLLLEKKAETPTTPDTTQLKSVLTDVAGLTQSDYTKDSWKVLADVVAKANALLQSSTYTEDEVSAMVKQLQQAKANLVKASTPEKPTDPETPTEPEKPTDPEQPTTPDTTTITSSDNKVLVKGNFGKDVQLSVKQVTVDKLNAMFKDHKLASSYQIEKGFDINLLKDGVTYLADGTIEVSFQLEDAFKNKELEVLYLGEDGTVEVLESTVEGGYIKFKTPHCSIYAIASHKTNTSPDTGDTTSTLPLAFMLGLSGAGLFFVSKKRKQNS